MNFMRKVRDDRHTLCDASAQIVCVLGHPVLAGAGLRRVGRGEGVGVEAGADTGGRLSIGEGVAGEQGRDGGVVDQQLGHERVDPGVLDKDTDG